VSSMEGTDVPIYGVQWHPERPQFEWSDEGFNHNPAAVAAMQYMANFFVSEARKASSHAFPDDSPVWESLKIWNFSPLADGNSYQCYFFD